MNILRVLIADDEPLARDRLRSLLKAEPSVELVGECGNGPDAIAAIRNAAPDLVFLDIEMPGASGIDVARAIPAAKRPALIFVTAHDRFAVDAFDLHAVDYLLKPFDRDRFRAALQRAQEHLRPRAAAGAATDGEAPAGPGSAAPGEAGGEKRTNRLAVKTDGRLVLLKPDDIAWVEAADNYVVLHLKEGRLMLRETLTALEERLGPASFTRVNRSALVHLDQIRELQPTFHGDYMVILRDGTKIPLSRSLRGQLEKFVGERLG